MLNMMGSSTTAPAGVNDIDSQAQSLVTPVATTSTNNGLSPVGLDFVYSLMAEDIVLSHSS